MRRSLAVGVWLAVTVTATLIVWAAVSVVAADVTDRPAPVVAHHDVVVALGSASPGQSTTTMIPAAPTAPARPATSAPPTTTPASAAPRPATTTTPTVLPTTPTTAPPGRPPVPTTTVPPTTAPPTTVAPGASATYATAGGVAAVACTGFNSIRLVAALPDDGYQAIVTSGGPYFVQVNFVGHGSNLPVSAACVFGVPFEASQFSHGATGGPGG